MISTWILLDGPHLPPHLMILVLGGLLAHSNEHRTHVSLKFSGRFISNDRAHGGGRSLWAVRAAGGQFGLIFLVALSRSGQAPGGTASSSKVWVAAPLGFYGVRMLHARCHCANCRCHSISFGYDSWFQRVGGPMVATLSGLPSSPAPFVPMPLTSHVLNR